MFYSRQQHSLIYILIGACWCMCLITNAMVIDAFTVKNLRARDFSGKIKSDQTVGQWFLIFLFVNQNFSWFWFWIRSIESNVTIQEQCIHGKSQFGCVGAACLSFISEIVSWIDNCCSNSTKWHKWWLSIYHFKSTWNGNTTWIDGGAGKSLHLQYNIDLYGCQITFK